MIQEESRIVKYTIVNSPYCVNSDGENGSIVVCPYNSRMIDLRCSFALSRRRLGRGTCSCTGCYTRDALSIQITTAEPDVITLCIRAGDQPESTSVCAALLQLSIQSTMPDVWCRLTVSSEVDDLKVYIYNYRA